MAISRIPLGHNIGSRDGTLNKDSKVGNAIIEIEKKESTAIVKRPGLLTYQTPPSSFNHQPLPLNTNLLY